MIDATKNVEFGKINSKQNSNQINFDQNSPCFFVQKFSLRENNFITGNPFESTLENGSLNKIQSKKLNLKIKQIKQPKILELKKICRICYEKSKKTNKLLFPCNCKGSMKFIHEDCLKKCLLSNLNEEAKCEICGFPYKFIEIKKKKFSWKKLKIALKSLLYLYLVVIPILVSICLILFMTLKEKYQIFGLILTLIFSSIGILMILSIYYCKQWNEILFETYIEDKFILNNHENTNSLKN